MYAPGWAKEAHRLARETGVRGVGPIDAVVMLVLLVALACLGVHRARLAGALLVALPVLQFAARAIWLAAKFPGEAGPPLLDGSAGVLILPALLLGILFFVSGSLAGERLHLGR